MFILPGLKAYTLHVDTIHQWRSYTGAHWGTGPTINILFYHVHGVNSYTYFIYTNIYNCKYLVVKVHPLVSLAVGL